MKILLVNPPQTFYPGSDLPAGNLPLGLMYIAAVLEKAGHKTEILDAFMTDVSVRKFGDTAEIGMTYEKITSEIRQRSPDIVGISNPFTCQTQHAAKVADIVKEIDQTIPTIVGGPHVSAVPEEFLTQAENVDVAVLGEGEYSMRDIVYAYEGKREIADVQGIVYRKDDALIRTPNRPFLENLDELPFPAYHLVDMEKYLNPEKIEYRSFKDRSISMITSRGCPFNCSFCAVHLHMGKAFRAHSVEYVVNHIEHVVNEYNVKTIFFEDDNMTFDIERFAAICDGILNRPIKFKWETPNGIRADYLNLELLKKMKKSGCQSVFFGVESGDQHVLDDIISKSLDLKAVINVAKMCRDIRLNTAAFYIIGFPGERKEDMMKTVDFALKLKKEYDVGMLLHVATPSCGTRLYYECKEKGYIRTDLTPRAFAEVRQAQGNPLIGTDDFTPSEVKEIAALAMNRYKKISLINYIKNPRKTLGTMFGQPKLIGKFVKNLLS
ncbi:MAG TPA: radical SAM protein [Candidatus Sulfotelmatobacter sp.]|nr:radical SAM protein [Candidatus Sulfotelmatobacter sp.]